MEPPVKTADRLSLCRVVGGSQLCGIPCYIDCHSFLFSFLGTLIGLVWPIAREVPGHRTIFPEFHGVVTVGVQAVGRWVSLIP